MVNYQLFYWHWLLLGIVLAMAEMFLASFTLLWFGLGAILVGVVLLVFPSMSLGFQLFAWIVFSGGFAVFWFKYFRPLMVDKTKAGIAREAVIGESGTVIKTPIEGSRGIARFTIPVLGEDEWEFICEQIVAVGDRVHIKDVSGNTLIVIKR
ncbi:MAG: NfeD family protein [Methylococcales bacterium]